MADKNSKWCDVSSSACLYASSFGESENRPYQIMTGCTWEMEVNHVRWEPAEFEALKGKTIEKIIKAEDDSEVLFFVKTECAPCGGTGQSEWANPACCTWYDPDECCNCKGTGVIKTTYKMYHEQDCCESVYIEDICGDLGDLVGSPLTQAEVSTNDRDPPKGISDSDDIFLWTFYKLATAKGYVTIRWYGQIHGYYSLGVDFVRRR